MKQTKPLKKYLAPNEVAELLMVSTESVRQWSQKGWLKAETTPGGHRRYLRQNVERFARERGYIQTDSEKNNLRILVVDDDRQFASYLEELLGGLDDNITVKVVNDGFSAGAQVFSFRPDIILLDLMMPALNGFEVCKLLKEDVATHSIRIIAMTGFPTDENVRGILSMGAEHCLSKPIDTAKLFEAIGLQASNTAMR